MKTTLLLMVLAVAGVGAYGCRSLTQNTQYLADDTMRFLGLDEPTMLHTRNLVATDYYTPYK